MSGSPRQASRMVVVRVWHSLLLSAVRLNNGLRRLGEVAPEALGLFHFRVAVVDEEAISSDMRVLRPDLPVTNVRRAIDHVRHGRMNAERLRITEVLRMRHEGNAGL